MAYWHMTKKVARLAAIDPTETVLHAVYGLSASFVSLANASAKGVSNLPRAAPNPFQADLWSTDFDGTEGLAEPLQCTGVIAVTDQRVIYFKKATVVGRPKHIVAVWSHDQIAGADYDAAEKVLKVRFTDGSEGGLHVPKSQQPQKFLEAIAACASKESGDAS